MTSPFDSALRDLDCLDEHLSRFGFSAPELDEVEIFHESTKLHPYQLRVLGARIGNYLTHPRAVRETAANHKVYPEAQRIQLPRGDHADASMRDVLHRRRSCRKFSPQPLTREELSVTLLAAYSHVTLRSSIVADAELRFRPYPSGGGLFPTEIYVAIVNVEGLEPCLAYYDARDHALDVIAPLLSLGPLAAALGDESEKMTANVGCIAFVSIVPERSVVKYGRRGYRFSLLEAGMVPFVLDLAATAQGLGTLHWGGFFDDAVNVLLSLDGASESVTSCLFIGKAHDKV